MGLRPVGVRASRAATAALLGAALVVAGCGSTPTKVALHTPAVQPARPLKPVPSPAPHYKAVDFGMLRLWVPQWYAIGAVCDQNVGTVFEGPGPSTQSCPEIAANTITMNSYGGAAGRGSERVVHGFRVIEIRPGFYEVPALLATIALHGRIPAAVLGSIGPSPFGEVTAPGPKEAVPGGWRQVAYHGVVVDVPPSWPTVASTHIEWCAGPFLSTPVAFVGPTPNTAPICPFVQYFEYPTRAGVWLQPGDQIGSPSRPFTTPDGQRLQLATGPEEAQPLLYLGYHGETITLGIGTDPAETRAVLDSVRYDPAAADSKAGGTCATWRQTTMPAPERATTTRTFDGLLNAQTELRPVAPGVEPRISAAAAWNTTTRNNLRPGVTYEIILGKEIPRWRVSGPMTVTAGHRIKLVPASPDSLVWAIYGAGTNTPFGDCGGYSVAIVDATTGKELLMGGGD